MTLGDEKDFRNMWVYKNLLTKLFGYKYGILSQLLPIKTM